MEIKLLGVRGTIPVHGEDYACFGGATGCVLVRAGEECILLDAGSGLREEPFRAWLKKERFSLLLSHSHVDHLLGFPIFPPFFDESLRCAVYLKTRTGLDARQQIRQFMAPPLWPIGPDSFRADVSFHDLPRHFAIGDVQVETMEGRHPGGASIYKLSHEGKSLVYATDFEPEEQEEAFVGFAGDCDLLLLDAQYTDEEYSRTRGFGHSTMARSASLAARCRARQTVFIHHDPKRKDASLAALEEEFQKNDPRIRFGREGEEICL